MTTESRPAADPRPLRPSPRCSSGANPWTRPTGRRSTSSIPPPGGRSRRRRSGAARTSIARSRRPRRPSTSARAGRTGRPASAVGASRSSPTSSRRTARSWPGSRAATSASRSAAARGEVIGASLVFDYYAGAANKVFGQTIPVSKPGLDLTLREPIGVVGLIVPWNFPILMASLEGRAGARRREHRDPQARVVHAADRDPPRRARARSRHPGRRPQHRDRAGRHGRRVDRRPRRASARSRSPARRRPARRSCGWRRAT